MKRLLTAITASVLLSITAHTAQADPFLVELDGPWMPGQDVNLRQSLGFVEIETIQAGPMTYMVVEARDEAYIETYFRAKGVQNPKIMAIQFTHESEGSPETQDNAFVVGWAIAPHLLPTN